tara:strand:+ start:1680 stop:2366 length:687 start_codon:yes stop_codon:yes gene_type:complete
MSQLSRYRLFAIFLTVPLLVIAFIAVLVANLIGGSEEAASPSTKQAPTSPTIALLVEDKKASASPAPLPTASPTAAPTFTPSPTPAPPAPTATPIPSPQEYLVNDNDSLSGIANAAGLTATELAEFNNLDNPDSLTVGQKLLVPPEGTIIKITRTPTPSVQTARATVVTQGGFRLNVRSAPSLNAEIVLKLENGDFVDVTGATTQAEGILWYQTVPGNWVASTYLDIP